LAISGRALPDEIGALRLKSTPEPGVREVSNMANETDDEIERAAIAEFEKYADRVKDIDDLSGVQLMAQEHMLQQLIRIRLELSALRLSLGGVGGALGDAGF
jgi:hypothetical protein